jgi:tetratricopeptide (TPR) repeat protein
MSVRTIVIGLAALVFATTGLGCRTKGSSPSNAQQGDGGWMGLSFVEDDYQAALRRARAERHLMFIDAWAPWCHTCLSMKAFVFGDPALAPLAPRFVWVSIDTEKMGSEPFLRKFPMKNWPTLWVVDPETEKPLLKWVGSLTASELVTLLVSATDVSSPASAGMAEATAAWLHGNRKAAEGDHAAAIAEYRSALEQAPGGWAVRARVVEALALQLQVSGHADECLALSLREWPALPPGTSRLDVALAAIGCAGALPTNALDRTQLDDLARAASRMANDPAEPVLADDRSSLFEALVGFYRAKGDEPEALAIARKWRDFLDGEAAHAPSPRERVVFDSHRVDAYAASGEPAKAISILEQSERDFPDDYDSPSRLARVYLDVGRLDDALAAVKRAEAKIYGPRGLRVIATEADIWMAMKRPKEAKAALARAIELGEKLELIAGSYRDFLGQLKARAARL